MQYHQTAVVPREAILRAEVEWLTSIKADLVVRPVYFCHLISTVI
jgi:L-arabinokinase